MRARGLSWQSICLSIGLLVLATCHVSANCHYLPDCEDLDDDLVTGERWDHSNNNEVHYRIKEHYSQNMPRLRMDVKRGGRQWTDIYFNSTYIDFGVVYGGTTTVDPFNTDNVNAIGWASLPWDGDEGVLAQVEIWGASDNWYHIIEADMGFNYQIFRSKPPSFRLGIQIG